MTSSAAGNASFVDRSAPLALHLFGFSESEVERIDRLPQGVKNLNFKVRARGEDWVLKCHRAPGVADRLDSSHAFELRLFEAGFPVARPQHASAGHTTVQTEAGTFTLHAWVAGQQISIDRRDATLGRYPDLAGALGSTLGVLHRVGVESVADCPARVDIGGLLAGPRRTVTSLRRGRPPHLLKLFRLRLRAPKSEFDRWILSTFPDLRRDAEFLASAEASGALPASDIVLAHNDVNWENLIFDSDFNLRAVLDFDNAALLPRVLDVGAVAAVLVGADDARLERFLVGYSKASGHQAELPTVHLGMRWKCVRSILWSIDSYLSGRVADDRLIATWCRYLYDCLRALPSAGSTN